MSKEIVTPEPVVLTGASGAQYELGESIGSFGDTPASECDAPDGGRYYGPGGTIVCRCIVCSRCGHHTGNSTQGHFWAYCSVTLSKREFHLCCPNDCELEVAAAAEPVTPHPTSGDVPRVLKVKVLRSGGHVKVRVYIGQEGHPGYCGELTMRPEEWREFANVLILGQHASPTAAISYEGDAYDWLYPTPKPTVSDKRAEEIRCELNGFIVHEYETVSDIVWGRAVHSREITGSDWNLDKAIDWALNQPEVSMTCGPDKNGGASVELIDGTVIAWDGELWCFEVADEVSS